MRGGQENKKAADGGERATARRSPGTTHGSSRPAPRAGLSRVFCLPQQSDRKAAISVQHRQPATARPVDHRLFARSLWSRLQPAAALRLHSQGRSSTRLDNRADGPRQRSRPKGRDGQGRVTRTGGRGTGSGRDRHPHGAAGSIALTNSGGGRRAGRNRGRDPKGDALFIRGKPRQPVALNMTSDIDLVSASTDKYLQKKARY